MFKNMGDVSESTKQLVEAELSPLDYFFEFQKRVELYSLNLLYQYGKESALLRLCLMREFDFPNIVGQRLAKHMIRKEVVIHIRNRSVKQELCANRQPLSMIFAGPSGNGKTELAVWLAGLLNKPEDDFFLKVDCGKLSEGNEVFGMSGAYQGAYEGSALNNFVARMSQQPESIGIVLLDEIEKSDKSVIHGLYQVIDKGEWTNKRLVKGAEVQAEVVRCDNIIFVMTTNAADQVIIEYAAKHRGVYTATGDDLEEIQQDIKRRVQKKL